MLIVLVGSVCGTPQAKPPDKGGFFVFKYCLIIDLSGISIGFNARHCNAQQRTAAQCTASHSRATLTTS
jgi:hypothetical protein